MGQLNSIKLPELEALLGSLQRKFEVTKRVYEFYESPRGGRGYGTYTALYRYWLLSTALLLSYCRSDSLSHLSTSLKLSDLLCSQSEVDCLEAIPRRLLGLRLLIEVLCVEELLSHLGVRCDF